MPKLTGNFTIINNTVLRDKRMGCTERGAYVCVCRSDCHSCTGILPTLAGDCPRALPGKL